MTYFPHSKNDIDEMLKFIGKKNLQELANPIPENLQSHGVDLPKGKSELEVASYFDKLGKKNKQYDEIEMYINDETEAFLEFLQKIKSNIKKLIENDEDKRK